MLRVKLTVTKSYLASVLGAFVVFALLPTPAAQSQSQPGWFLIGVRADVILECNIDGSNCFNLTAASGQAADPGGGSQEASYARNPSIARNGTIAINAAYNADGTCSGAGNAGCEGTVFLMNADGTNVRQLTFAPPSDACYTGDFDPAISPDGTMVAFVSDRNCACCVNGGPASMWELYVVNIDGSGMQQVTPFVYDENGNLITGPGGVYTIAWSPDSKTLAYKGIEYGTFCGLSEGSPQAFLAVATINADGTNKTFLACDASGAAGGPLAIDWSPDGTLIADARDYVSFGGTPIRITDLTGEGRYAAGLTLAELGTPPSGDTLCSPGSYLGGQYNCLHFSPDSTQLAYINNTPADDPTFSGISTINLDGTGRLDAVSVATSYTGQGIWWAPGPAIPAAEQITLTPSTVEVWPGFSQQLTPNLLDANGNVISHTASAFNLDTSFPTACGAQIGPYGFAMSPASVSAPNEESTISVSNEGLATAYAPFICWPSPPCNYTLTSNGENSPADGGPGLAGVIANLNPGITGSSCPWVTTSNAPWITITTGPDGSGTNNVGFTVAENTGPARQGAMSIAGLTFTVSQHAGVLLAPPALTFAAQKVGTTSAPQTLTLSNYLTSWLSLNGATMDGTNAKDFAMSTSCVSRLAPESSCSYVITFKPSVTVSGGERATLSISYGDGTLTAPLFGTGVAGPMSPQ